MSRRRPVPVEVVSFPAPRTMEQNRVREANLVSACFSVICALACVCGLVPAVGRAVSSFFVVVIVGAVVAAVLHQVIRRVRVYREDREDERVAALWREAHAEPARSGGRSGTPARVA
ncbi:hypothetical protein [Pseudonocardia lacus]|uniref:hypothetical protein n=1 Tax=Pseudonocardia lacus TaxID=2835865 RepID=UPI001BDDA94E|nr:hypothetical protein [Pseudonocardia lacus]